MSDGMRNNVKPGHPMMISFGGRLMNIIISQL